MTVELQVQLTELSAPGQFVDWARPFPDLKSCWNKCQSPEYLLWLAARLCNTAEERRAVVSCLAELTRRAERGRHADRSAAQSTHTVETWLQAGVSLDDLLAAERAAREAAAWSATVAAEEKARARQLFRVAPRGRPASLGTSRALDAMAGWREAEHAMRVALAVAGTARAAAAANRAGTAVVSAAADGAPAVSGPAVSGPAVSGPAHGSLGAGAPAEDGLALGGPAHSGAAEPGGEASSAESWESCVGESAGYAVGALTSGHPAGRRDRAARRAARLIRRRLPCPQLG
jgi:hypothetical protein